MQKPMYFVSTHFKGIYFAWMNTYRIIEHCHCQINSNKSLFFIFNTKKNMYLNENIHTEKYKKKLFFLQNTIRLHLTLVTQFVSDLWIFKCQKCITNSYLSMTSGYMVNRQMNYVHLPEDDKYDVYVNQLKTNMDYDDEFMNFFILLLIYFESILFLFG